MHPGALWTLVEDPAFASGVVLPVHWDENHSRAVSVGMALLMVMEWVVRVVIEVWVVRRMMTHQISSFPLRTPEWLRVLLMAHALR